MKISILYFSQTGNTKRMANAIAEGANKVNGIHAKTISISDIDATYLKDSSCIILGTPTHYTSMSSEVKTWLDHESAKYNLPGKLGGAFATEAYVHGGADLAIQGILTHMLITGMVIYSSGEAQGEPPIHLGPVALSGSLDEYLQLFITYGERMAKKTSELF